MPHDCIDWTTRPPTRKLPFLVLIRGDDRVYTAVPKELKALEEIAKKEFGLGDVDVYISSSCVNLCNGLSARITKAAWEHISSYIGCATVEVVEPGVGKGRAPQEQLPRFDEEQDAGVREKQLLNADEPEHRLGGRPEAFAKEVVGEEEGASSDHGADHSRVATPEDQHEEPEDEEVTMGSPRKARYQRRVVSEDDGEGDESEREHEIPAQSQVPASPLKPNKEIKRERPSDHRSQPDERPDKPIKQEKRDPGSASHSQPHSLSETRTRASTESGESYKLMIRVAHRPSKQESKFTTKSTTRVAKVLAGACKSFGLDASLATLYLIVSMEDEDGELENLFPCDKGDTIARAGAERDSESRFLLKIAGEE